MGAKKPHPQNQSKTLYVTIVDGGGILMTRANRYRPWRVRCSMRGATCVGEVMLAWALGRIGMPKKPEVSGSPSATGVTWISCKLLVGCPTLRSYLNDTAYEGTDEKRQCSTLIISPQRGVWHITLKDPSTATQLRVSVETLDKAFPTLEALLSSPGCPWEEDEWAAARLSKKRK